MNKMESETYEQVQDYYGKILNSNQDLKTNACCTNVNYPNAIKKILPLLSDEVVERYYGCGLTIPNNLKGRKILDLGSGSGRDCFILSKLVGESGEVVGIDMTDEQLNIAQKNISYHKDKFGHPKSNVRFIKGNIEDLKSAGLENDSFDAIVSNCVINLSPDKESVFKEAFRVLKDGGEIYFSDVYSDRRVPEDLKKDKILYGECLGGALYWNDFCHLVKKIGFTDPRMVDTRKLTIENDEIQKRVGNITFHSITYRLFKHPKLELDCEDYGQAVLYKGTIEDSPDYFELDAHHRFEKGQVQKVCGNTFIMLNESRFHEHFDTIGDMSTHHGIFENCGISAPFSNETNAGCC